MSKQITVKKVIPIEISESGMIIDGILHAWTSWYPGRLAEYDYIVPATGEVLKDVLFGIYGIPSEPTDYIIIWW